MTTTTTTATNPITSPAFADLVTASFQRALWLKFDVLADIEWNHRRRVILHVPIPQSNHGSNHGPNPPDAVHPDESFHLTLKTAWEAMAHDPEEQRAAIAFAEGAKAVLMREGTTDEEAESALAVLVREKRVEWFREGMVREGWNAVVMQWGVEAEQLWEDVGDVFYFGLVG